MAHARPKVEVAEREVRTVVRILRSRCNALALAHAPMSEWRRLQFDAVSALVTAQRAFVQVHTEIVRVLSADRQLYRKLRIASLELTLAIDELRELVRTIERQTTSN